MTGFDPKRHSWLRSASQKQTFTGSGADAWRRYARAAPRQRLWLLAKAAQGARPHPRAEPGEDRDGNLLGAWKFGPINVI